MNTYTTTQGDTWDIVSYRVYGGEEGYMGDLLAANPEHISTVFFPAGVVLAVPAITPRPPVANLPPWHNGG